MIGNGITSRELVLEILNVQPEDSGEYLCTASFGYCHDSATTATVLSITPLPGGVFTVHVPLCIATVEPLYNGHHWDQKFCPL